MPGTRAMKKYEVIRVHIPEPQVLRVCKIPQLHYFLIEDLDNLMHFLIVKVFFNKS
jgi:hypothetical protein